VIFGEPYILPCSNLFLGPIFGHVCQTDINFLFGLFWKILHFNGISTMSKFWKEFDWGGKLLCVFFEVDKKRFHV
jgi:hypothetical protein